MFPFQQKNDKFSSNRFNLSLIGDCHKFGYVGRYIDCTFQNHFDLTTFSPACLSNSSSFSLFSNIRLSTLESPHLSVNFAVTWNGVKIISNRLKNCTILHRKKNFLLFQLSSWRKGNSLIPKMGIVLNSMYKLE